MLVVVQREGRRVLGEGPQMYGWKRHIRNGVWTFSWDDPATGERRHVRNLVKDRAAAVRECNGIADVVFGVRSTQKRPAPRQRPA